LKTRIQGEDKDKRAGRGQEDQDKRMRRGQEDENKEKRTTTKG